jgi:hypothetical protein
MNQLQSQYNSVTVFYNSDKENLSIEIPPHFDVISYGSTTDGLSYYVQHIEFKTTGNIIIMIKVLDFIFTKLKLESEISEFIITINE